VLDFCLFIYSGTFLFLLFNLFDICIVHTRLVLSHTAVRSLVDSDECHCGADDAPDDMTLGICLKRMDIPVVHSALFHQVTPQRYFRF